MQGKRISNSRIKPKGDVAAEATRGGAGGLAFLRIAEEGEIEGARALREGLSPEQQAELLSSCGATSGDLLLFAAGHPATVNRWASSQHSDGEYSLLLLTAHSCTDFVFSLLHYIVFLYIESKSCKLQLVVC